MDALPDPHDTGRRLDIKLAEYTKLKSEQVSRIGFRDNLLYVTLGVVGALCAYAMAGPQHRPALLLVPWACFVLGWTYLVNDEKISAIGRYLRDELGPGLQTGVGVPPAEQVLGWERAHRVDRRRFSRKCFQLFVDLIAFCASSAAALFAFVWLEPGLDGPRLALVCAGSALVLMLAVWIWIYADLGAE